MPTYNEQKKANLVEFSLTYYQKFLAALNHSMDRRCSLPDRLLCLSLYFRYITAKQFHLLFPLKGKEIIRATLNRLIKRGFFERMGDIPAFHAYAITQPGTLYIRRKLPLLFSMFCPFPDDGTYHFTVDEVLSVMDARIGSPAPSYWHHFFGIRDFYFTFLSNPLTCSDFLFLQECIVENGQPLSIYQQQLYAGSKGAAKGISLRSDGLIKSPCPADPSLDIPLYIEFDSGSQRGSVLASKVGNYVKSSLAFFRDYGTNDAMKVHMPPSVVFCISAKYAGKKKPEPARRLSKGKYSGCLSRALEIYDVVSSLDILPEDASGTGATLSSCIRLLESIDGRLEGSTAGEILPVLLRYKEEYPFDTARPILSILKELAHKKEALSSGYEKDMKSYYADYYEKRKKLLLHSVMDAEIPGLSSSLLSGLSVFTVSHELLQDGLPYLIPELYWYSSSLATYLSDFGCYGETLTLTYRHIGELGGRYLLRNHYSAEDVSGTFRFFFENISDDIGGWFRIKNMLSFRDGSCISSRSKVVCIVSEEFLMEHGKEIIGSSCYRSLPSLLPKWDKESFELLFCTPQDLEAGRFFLLLPDGKRCYKVRA